MRVLSSNASALTVCSRLAREVADLFNFDNPLHEGPERKPHSVRRTLRLEPLEVRHMLDAASVISAVWFANVADADEAGHAGVADWTVESESGETEQYTESGETDAYDWIIQFDTGVVSAYTSITETAALLSGGGIDFTVLCGLGLVGQVLVRSSDAVFEQVQSWLDENQYVTYYEQDAISQVDTTTASDPYYDSLWGLDYIDAEQSWDLTTGSSSVVVAVIDTGVDYTHVDLAANIWMNPGEIAGNGIDDDGNGFVDDVYGYDFVNDDGDPMDDNSHGTHVSGTIAAVANNGVGVTGVTWSTSVMALKFLDSNGSGYLSDAVRAINYATMMRTQYDVNVRVMSNSWGGGGYSTAMYNAIQASNNADILFVAAAGNTGSNNDVSAQYPANYSCDNVISVAAITQSGQLASFSSYGATTVDLAAPGVSILSTVPGNSYSWYSGTSMATPHVSAVAALCFALNPDATAADVRDAILDGVETSSTLTGKVATGGTLNAYNTLQLIGEEVSGPILSSLVASPNAVTVGQTVTLTASGISDDSGTVTRVDFYRDSNNNGQYDATDQMVGSTYNIAGGTASISINTSSLSAGTHRFLARAVDNNSQSSDWATASLSVLPADDHGDSAATATALAVPDSVAATLAVVGDTDWFEFEAVAGKTYVFTTQLGSLSDSTLTLYDSNGTAALESNDDFNGSLASQITWTATDSGTFYIVVGSFSSGYAGTYVLSAAIDNTAPELSPIDDQTISHQQTTLSINLDASDADGDALSYEATAVSVDPMAYEAYQLDQQYGLYQWHGSFWTNLRGYGEKYLASSELGVSSPFFILPNGDLYRWTGSIESSEYITTLATAYYDNPFLLSNANEPAYTPVDAQSVQLSISGDVLTIVRDADYMDDFVVQVTVSDGTNSDVETFSVSVTNDAPELDSIGDQTMSYSQSELSVDLGATDADGDSLSYSIEIVTVDSMAEEAYQLDQEYGLYQWHGSFWTNIRGYGEKYLASSELGVSSPFFILPNGDLYRWTGGIETSEYVTTLGTEYYDNPFLLCSAEQPDYVPVNSADVSASVADGVLTLVRDADFTNDFMVRVTVSDGLASSSESFMVSVTNLAPQLTPVGDQTMSDAQTTLVIDVEASDADGDRLSYSAQALAADPMAEEAYQLDQQYGLYQWHGSFWTNLRGYGEKYLASSVLGVSSPFFILPNGDLYRWTGSIESGEYVTTLDTAYYDDPFLICNAQEPALSTINAGAVGVNMTGNQLTISRSAGYTSDFYVQVSVSDGYHTSIDTFRISTAGTASLQSFASPIEAPSFDAAEVETSAPADRLAVLLAHDDALLSADLLSLRIEDLTDALDETILSELDASNSRSTGLEEALQAELAAHRLSGFSNSNRLSSVGFERVADSSDSLDELRIVDGRLIDEVFDSLAEQLELVD